MKRKKKSRKKFTLKQRINDPYRKWAQRTIRVHQNEWKQFRKDIETGVFKPLGILAKRAEADDDIKERLSEARAISQDQRNVKTSVIRKQIVQEKNLMLTFKRVQRLLLLFIASHRRRRKALNLLPLLVYPVQVCVAKNGTRSIEVKLPRYEEHPDLHKKVEHLLSMRPKYVVPVQKEKLAPAKPIPFQEWLEKERNKKYF